jgi:hypothetical protein
MNKRETADAFGSIGGFLCFGLCYSVGALGGPDGVVEEHGDGHWAYTTGNGCDGRGFFFYAFEIDITNEAIARFR